MTDAPWIRTVPWADAEGTLKDAYDWQAARLGEPTEFTQLGSLYPELVLERLRLYKVVDGTPSRLSPFERQIAAYVVSTLNGTPHCSSGLVHKLGELGATPTLLADLRIDPLGTATGDPRLDAIVGYAVAVTRSPASLDEADVERLRSVGLDDLDILDLNNLVAYYNYINRVANGLGLRTEISSEHARFAVPR